MRRFSTQLNFFIQRNSSAAIERLYTKEEKHNTLTRFHFQATTLCSCVLNARGNVDFCEIKQFQLQPRSCRDSTRVSLVELKLFPHFFIYFLKYFFFDFAKREEKKIIKTSPKEFVQLQLHIKENKRKRKVILNKISKKKTVGKS